MANLRSIQMQDDGHGVASVTVTVTLLELIYLTKLLGKQSGITANEVMRDGARASADLFATLRRPLLAFYEDAEDDREAIEHAWKVG